MEINGKDLNKVWNGFLILLIIVFGIQYISNDDDPLKGMIQTMLEENYQGIVTQKFIDYPNHAMRVLILNTQKRVTIDRNFYELIAVNDSISKKRDDHLIFVYKKNDTLIFDENKKIQRIRAIREMQDR